MSDFFLNHLFLNPFSPNCQVFEIPTTPSLPSSLCPTLQNVYVNINRIMSVGNRLLESGHYASQQIKQISSQLEQEWKAFAAALDERSTLLEMSASFHQKCDQVSQTHMSMHVQHKYGKSIKFPAFRNVRTFDFTL